MQRTMKRTQGGFIEEQMQRNTEALVRDSVPTWIADGIMLISVNVGTSATSISHGLRRQPQGFLVSDIQGSATIWRTGWDSNFLFLQASTPVTVNLWVF